MFTQVLRREFNPAITNNSALSDMFENLMRVSTCTRIIKLFYITILFKIIIQFNLCKQNTHRESFSGL